LTHVLALDALPFHHKDPFDRLLIAQSNAEGLTLVTADSQFSAYSVRFAAMMVVKPISRQLRRAAFTSVS
jgi:PIN domain nuclease of toxin-antitoxin system